VIEHGKAHSDPLLAFEAEAEPAPSSGLADRESQVLADRPLPLDDHGSQDHVDPVSRLQSADGLPSDVAAHGARHAVAAAAVRRIAAPIPPPIQRPAMALLRPMALVGGVLAATALAVWTFSGDPSASRAPVELVSRGVSPALPLATPNVAGADRVAVSAETVESTTTFQAEPAGPPELSDRVASPDPVRAPSESAPSREVRIRAEAAAPPASPFREREPPVDPRPVLALPPETVPPPSRAPLAMDIGSAGSVPQRDTAAVAEASGVSSSIPTPAREDLTPVIALSTAAESSTATAERPLEESESIAPLVEVVPALSAEDAVRGTLGRYAAAFEAMDVEATAQVWPSVDQRALARAFRGLESQRVAFDACDIDVTESRAVADCRGTVRYVARLGDGAPRTEGRRWLFRLNRQENEWRIDRLEASRP
jgi:hypothetical protein